MVGEVVRVRHNFPLVPRFLVVHHSLHCYVAASRCLQVGTSNDRFVGNVAITSLWLSWRSGRESESQWQKDWESAAPVVLGLRKSVPGVVQIIVCSLERVVWIRGWFWQ